MNKQSRRNSQRAPKRRSKVDPQSQKIILFSKPFGVLCQFSPDGDSPTLRDYIDAPGFYPAGRLDKDSEGLLILTNNGQLQHAISHPLKKLTKTYLVQLDGEVTEQALQQLESGIELKDGLTRPAVAQARPVPEWLWPRTPPIRTRQNIPTSWITLEITEGKNRQIRRMTAAVGFPTLRLIRYAIGDWTIDKLNPGDCLSIQA